MPRYYNRPGLTGYPDVVETLAALVDALREGGVRGGTLSPGELTTDERPAFDPYSMQHAEGRLAEELPGSTPRLREEVIRQVRNWRLRTTKPGFRRLR